MARPMKLTGMVEAALFLAIYHGASYRQACDFAGISYRTFRNWIIRAEKIEESLEEDSDTKLSEKDESLVEFLHHIKRAKGRRALLMLQRINESDDWRAAAWQLERAYPRNFGPSFLNDPQRPR